jgi:hypothetical protein
VHYFRHKGHLNWNTAVPLAMWIERRSNSFEKEIKYNWLIYINCILRHLNVLLILHCVANSDLAHLLFRTIEINRIQMFSWT